MKRDIQGFRTWIEIDRSAVKHNYEQFRSLIPQSTKLCGVVKSNAYGHGFIDFARELEVLGVDMFAVDSVSEALRLRKEGLEKPILVLGYTLPEKIIEASQDNIALTVSQFETLEFIKNLDVQQKIKIHIKVDTGMHRQGFLEEYSDKLVVLLKEISSKVEVVGLFSHLASADDPQQILFTEIQVKRLLVWKEIFTQAGFSFMTHIGATSGVIGLPEAHFDMVRVGAGLYGVWPSEELRERFSQTIILKPVLSWKAIISEIKKVPQGDKIGYGLTEEFTRDTVVGIVPIGYWHGFDRGLSSKGNVLVNGERTKVLGRVSMDMIAIDLTGIDPVEVLNEAVLIGKSGSEEIFLQDIASLIDTSSYEVMTRLNPLIKKIYV